MIPLGVSRLCSSVLQERGSSPWRYPRRDLPRDECNHLSCLPVSAGLRVMEQLFQHSIVALFRRLWPKQSSGALENDASPFIVRRVWSI